MTRPKPRMTTTERGYGHTHQQRRKALLADAVGRPCPMCGALMLHADTLDLDHATPLALGGDGTDSRIVHAVCNRRRGQALGTAIRQRRRHPAPPPVKRAQSREW